MPKCDMGLRPATAEPPPMSGLPRASRVITAPELSENRGANVYDAIRRVRPEILRTREAGKKCGLGFGHGLVLVSTRSYVEPSQVSRR
jgi:hypothetical protein